MAWYNSVAHAAGNVAAPLSEAAGAALSLGGLAQNQAANTFTNAGHAISNPNVVMNNPAGIFSSDQTPGISRSFAAVQPAAPIGNQNVASDQSTSQQNNQNNPLNTGGGTGADNAAQIGSIDAQTGMLRSTLSNADTQLQSGLDNLQHQYNQQQSDANLNHGRSLQDFQNTEQNDNLGHQQAIDAVNTKARTLANSVRQMIGNASGSGSSAYQLTAPGAVQRQADLQSQGINTDFGQNMTALKTAKDREAEDYGSLLTKLGDTFNQSRNGLQTQIEQQKQGINGTLADLAAQRAAYAGGGIKGAQFAAAPYQAQVNAASQAIKDIAGKYQSPFSSIAPVQVAAPTLRDYATGGTTNVATNQAGTQTAATPTFNPAATWLKQDQNQYAF